MVRYALARVKGIGLETADRLCHEHGIRPDIRLMRLSEAKIALLMKAIAESGILTGQQLTREVRGNISRLKSIGSYRGIRHEKNLPVRGQRTITNSRTARKMAY